MSFISFILLLILQKTLSQSLSINNYILKDPFPLNLSISNHTINYNCLTFEAFHSEEQEPYEEYEDTYENPVISNLKITILLADESIFDIKITDEHEKRFEIPSKVPFPKDSTLQYSCKSIEKAINKRDPKLPPSDFTIFLTKKNGEIELDNPSLLYKVKLIDNPFGIQIMRKSTGEFIYNTADCNFIYHDKYLEFQNKINTDFIMGFGERNFKSRLDIGGIYTTWSRDEPNEIEDGWPPGKNSYGFHPIYLRKEQSGKFDIGFLRSSHAFDMILLNDSIKIISVGGIIHWKYFLGDEFANNVVEKYHKYLGGYVIPPFWAMGFHQSRWGYKNLKQISQLIWEYDMNQIPFDVVHLDIDYMYNRQMFQVDQSRFNKMHFQNITRHIIPVVDVGVYPNFSDPIFLEAARKNLFIKNSIGEFFGGRCWPGTVVFPDFFHPETKFYWENNLEKLHSSLNFSGIWLDMNEISNFCDGECIEPDGLLIDSYKKFKEKEFESFFPYHPGFRSLQTRTIALNSVHYNNITELSLHPLNSLLQTYQTYNFLKYHLSHKLPFILSRSTYPGSGKFAIHWAGDLASEWSFLELSIPSMFSFNLFGIPMVGSDICGFEGDTSELLCGRWIQIGSLYPFARNHNHEHAKDQEFHRLGPTILETARSSLKLRYSLLKYYYALFISNKGKGMIIRPLFFEWPDINYFYDDNLIDREFLIGTDILCIPILSDKSNYTIGLLPNEPFYNFQTGEETMENLIFLYIGLNQSLPLFIRAGSIIHFQDVKNVKSTRDLNNIFKLFITMNNYNYHASGFLIGFDHLSEENIASCIANDYECIWEIVFNFKILETNDFIFEIEFIPNENTQKNNGTIEIEEIQIMGLKEKIKESLFTMDSGQVYVGNKTGIFMVGEAEMGRENDKTVIKCMISKKFTEKEKFYIRFVNEKQVDLGFIVLFLIGFACFQKIMLSTEEI